MTSLTPPFTFGGSPLGAAAELPQAMIRSLDRHGGNVAAPAPVPLEAVCIELLERLEQLRLEATQCRSRGRYGRAAAIGQRMLLAVLDFAEVHLAQQPLQTLKERIADAYEQSRRIEPLVANSSWSLMRRALGKASAASPQIAEAHGALGDAIAVAVITAVAGGEEQFQAGSELARQMADRLKSFVGQLRTDW